MIIKKSKIIFSVLTVILLLSRNIWATPAYISDLYAVQGSTPGSVYLTWYEPYDPGPPAGNIMGYDLRYSTTPINNDTDFSNATAVSPQPVPVVSGTYSSYTVYDLSDNYYYYFSIKSLGADETTWGPISNYASSYPKPNPPGNVTTLTISPLPGGQGVKLQWIAPGGDGTVGTVAGYKIKYYPGPSLDDFYWDTASEVYFYSIDSSNDDVDYIKSGNITGLADPLQQQTAYVYLYESNCGSNLSFAVKAYDGGYNYSDTITGYSTFTYIDYGTSSEGTASMLPATSAVTQQVTSTITFLVGSTPIGPGGEIAVNIPYGWTLPQSSDSGMPGYVSFATISGTANAGEGTLELTTTGQWIIISPTPEYDSQLYPNITGGEVEIYYKNGWTSYTSGNHTFYVYSKSCKSKTRQPIAASPVITLSAGEPSYITFDTYGLTIAQNTASPAITIVSKDENWTITNATGPLTVTLTGRVYNNNTYIYEADGTAEFSLSSGFDTTVTTVTIPEGSSSAPFYYRTSQTGCTQIEMSYNIKGYEQTEYIYPTVISGGGITDAKVHTGNYTANTNVIITPDGDGTNDYAYIDFSISDNNANWEVLLATSSDFAFPKWTYYGYGTPYSGQIMWNGMFEYYDPVTYYWMSENAPAGTYYIRIQFSGGAIYNDTLYVTVQTNEIAGTVTDSNTNPVSGVYVYAYGSAYAETMTDSNGNYTLAGLPSGTYTLNFWKDGYSYQSLSGISAGTTGNNVTLTQPAFIKINAQRSLSGSVVDPEQWGSVNLWKTSGSYDSYYGTLHFAVDVSTSDNGGWLPEGTTSYEYVNSTATYEGGKWTILEVTPGTYSLNALLEGYVDVSKTSISAVAGQVTTITDISFTRQKTVTGWVVLPEVVSGSYSAWISIEAIPSGYSYGTAWGNVEIPIGKSSGTYTIYGLSAGGYTLRTYAPGYQRGTTTVSISAGDDNVPASQITLTTGGTITGTLTVVGNTNSEELSSYFSSDPYYVYLNAWSPDSYSYGWTEVQITKSASSASNSFTISGLEDGTYWLTGWLYGFDLSGSVGWSGVRATVSGGTGSIDLTFNRYSGYITAKFAVPGNDYGNLKISINGPNLWMSEGVSTGTIISNFGASFDPATGILTTPPLGTGFYEITGLYEGTKITKKKAIMAINGQTKDAGTIDLTGTTYSVSGRVKINASNPLSSPYNVVGFIVSTAPVHNETWPPPTYESTTSFRVNAYDYSLGDRICGTATSAKNSMIHAASGDQEGTYQIDGLTPGIYTLQIPALDFNGDYVNDMQAHKKQVIITTGNITCNFELRNGYSISGRLKLPSGVTATRNFDIYVFDAKDYGINTWSGQVTYKNISFVNANSVNYTIEHLLPGEYVLSVYDYGYWDNGLGQSIPRQYANTSIKVKIKSSNLQGQDIQLTKGGTIKLKLKDTNSGTAITPSNRNQMLPANYGMTAIANPWVEGGYGSLSTVSGTSSGEYFELDFLPEAIYDLKLGQSEYGFGYSGFSSISGGSASNQTNYAEKTINSIEVKNNQTTDLGTIEIKQGLSISGIITDEDGTVLPNIPVVAIPSLTNEWSASLRGFTDINGKYTIVGLDPDITYYDIIACPRIDMSDFGGYYFFGAGGLTYGEKTKTMIKIAGSGSIDFTLSEALGSVSGTILTEDGGPLQNPNDFTLPSASVFLQLENTFPRTNMLGDIVVDTNLDGTFTIEALPAGTYNLTVLSGGYASHTKTITVGDTQLDVGSITLKVGAKISGSVTKINGEKPSNKEIARLVAATDDFSEVLIGLLVLAGDDTITSYEIAGFQAGSTYNIMFIDPGDEIIPAVLGFGVAYTSYTNTDYNLTYQPSAPTVFSRAKKDGNQFTIAFELTGALRNSIPADDDLTQIISLVTGGGILADRYIAPTRKSLTCTYTPQTGENRFSIKLSGYSRTENPETGSEFYINETLEYYTGIGAKNKVKISNLRGGKITLEGDSSNVSFSPGTFTTGSSTVSVTVEFTRAEDLETFTNEAPKFGAVKFAIPSKPAAYSGMTYKAMETLKTTGISPFSSFYEIMLPAGISRTLRKDATLSLQYSTVTVSNPNDLNVYYYDSVNNVYLLENSSKTVSADNNTVSVTINHTSVFVLLMSNQPTIRGNTYIGADPIVYNFPNPFDFTTKTKSLTHSGLTKTTKGTVVKYAIPPSYGIVEVEIIIYNIVGEVIRQIDEGVKEGGYYYYTDWDGENDYQKEVASGVYIGKLKIEGYKSKFFKMAVIK
ncbi:MAG: carboxypeptidase regulatory-like domain-containing protein [Elusimicrobia bacterium]|nr:carboxypeptidase regulatory-like domain-containing protein [Elusimicrobiota bacterium]